MGSQSAHRATISPERSQHPYCSYATSGHFQIDNNPAENAISPLAIGKVGWLIPYCP
ncbi:IS66 family transposase [Craterilacuibacter sinensis]|uniref:Transposase n=1 Tax=Craterilacuibacter sinensis TaxID=2686017 RepID=A0A845BP76_9NEIS|nr:transposase [Craterilacuibacter sinensis]